MLAWLETFDGEVRDPIVRMTEPTILPPEC